MLKEYPAVQRADEPPRRWFADDYFDLFVWYDAEGIASFQLCYDKRKGEHAVTWDRRTGFRHDVVDHGEHHPARNRSPMLLANGPFPAVEVLARFSSSSEDLEPELRNFIVERLGELRGK